MTAIFTRRNSDRAAGFTLVELLVTLVIMGLLAGMATIAVGGRAHRQARDEAERLYQLLGFASEEATLQGEELGVVIGEDAYSFMRFDGEVEDWVPMEEPHFAEHTLPPAIHVEVELGESYELPAGGKDDTGKPEILVLSSGEISPFKVEFISTDSEAPAARINSDGSGTIVWE